MFQWSNKPRYQFHWADHERHLCYAYNNFTAEHFGVCPVQVQGDLKIHVSKLQCAACSPFFKESFERLRNTPNAVIHLPDITSSILHHLMEYMYHGLVYVDAEKLEQFYAGAQRLHIKGLVAEDPNEEPRIYTLASRIALPINVPNNVCHYFDPNYQQNSNSNNNNYQPF